MTELNPQDYQPPQPPARETEPGTPIEPEGFFTRLPFALVYPFRGRGKYMIIAGAVFFAVVSILSLLPFVGFVVGVIVGAYVLAYMLKVAAESAAGEEDPPDWPDLTNLWDDLVRPLFLVMSVLVISALPLLVCLIDWLREFPYGDPIEPWVVWACAAWGVLYFPMGFLAVAMFSTGDGLNPILVIKSIAKVLLPYLVVVVLLAGCVLAEVFAQSHFVLPLPFLAPAMAGAFSLYFLMVEMRILGLIYHCYSRRLGWFETA